MPGMDHISAPRSASGESSICKPLEEIVIVPRQILGGGNKEWRTRKTLMPCYVQLVIIISPSSQDSRTDRSALLTSCVWLALFAPPSLYSKVWNYKVYLQILNTTLTTLSHTFHIFYEEYIIRKRNGIKIEMSSVECKSTD